MSGQLELGKKKIIREGEFYLFSVGFSELILILIIAYVFIGPQDLPKVAKWLGRVVRNTRAFILEIKKESGWDDVMNEAKDIQDTVSENKNTVQSALQDITEDFNNAEAKVNQTINEIKQDTFK